jgi:hypothetical protein
LAEECLERFASYLLHSSDLFQDADELDDMQMAEWEHAMETHMEKLLDGDVEPAPDLGNLKLDDLEAEHLRDFLGWHMLREADSDSAPPEEVFAIMRDWISYLCDHRWLTAGRHMEFMGILAELEPECVRAAKSASLLFHYVRYGGDIPSKLRGTPFSRFVEGHARISRIDGESVWLKFDYGDEELGPISLPASISSLLRVGDVMDAELGFRGDMWQIVDIGPVYPSAVYVEADEYEILDKVS